MAGNPQSGGVGPLPTELARRVRVLAEGTPAEHYKRLPDGPVLTLQVRRVWKVGSRAPSLILATDDFDREPGSYTEELSAAWELVAGVASDVKHGRRMLGGQK